MRVKSLISAFVLLAVLALGAAAEPFKIIIVTSDTAESERGYKEFLQDIYRGNVDVDIDPDRYDENLSDKKKDELRAADLIIVSRDNEGTDYNADADFWNEVNVPILNHNINLARSDHHRFWDWLDGNKAKTDPFTQLTVADGNDSIFAGVDTSSGTVQIFTEGKELEHSNKGSAGYGLLIATSDGDVVIARWLGGESFYYDHSDYGPGAARVFFAMPKMTCEFFDDATAEARVMLKNAILSLLPIYRPDGDLDYDLDVDFDDYAILSGYWMSCGCTEMMPCGAADITGDANVGTEDLQVLAESWLTGVDTVSPEPNVMRWETEPRAMSTTSLFMEADVASDLANGVEYYFECASGNGPDSGWQYGTIFEPNGLTPGTKYIYRVKARDTSSHLNETQWSSSIIVWTFGKYERIADASAAVALDSRLFIVADDEGSKLCIYDLNSAGPAPVHEPNVGQFLNVDPCEPETDIEGATWFKGRIFWITSHGRNRDGKYRYSRYQFFATTVTQAGEDVNVVVDGNYYYLIDDLIAYDSVYNLGLAEAIGVVDGHIDPNQIPELAPKEKGLNIEGLCASADGNSMFISFRNPRPEVNDVKAALIIRLRNPEEVVLSGAAAEFDAPILLDFDGLGIRSMEYSPTLGSYLIVAGSHKARQDEPLQILYEYDISAETVTWLYDFEILTPEAMFQFPDSNDIQLLSDDGTLMIDTPEGPVQNKLLPRELRTFRTQRITP